MNSQERKCATSFAIGVLLAALAQSSLAGSYASAQAISAADTQAISAADVAAISAADSQAISAADVTAITAADTEAISAADVTAITAADAEAISAADVTAITAADAEAISAADVTAISAADSLAISAADATAISAADAHAIRGADVISGSGSANAAVIGIETLVSSLATVSPGLRVNGTQYELLASATVDDVSIRNSTVTLLGNRLALTAEAMPSVRIGQHVAVYAKTADPVLQPALLAILDQPKLDDTVSLRGFVQSVLGPRMVVSGFEVHIGDLLQTGIELEPGIIIDVSGYGGSYGMVAVK